MACPSDTTSCCRASCALLMASTSSPCSEALSSSSLPWTFALMSSGTLSASSSSCFSVWYTIESAWFLTSTASLLALSSSANFSASFTIRSTSSELRVLAPVILMSDFLFVPLSRASTLRMPLASMSNLTSTCGTPRGAGGIPSSLKLPKSLLSLTNSLSPWYTLISTLVWLSAAVEKVSDLEVGSVVFLGMSLVITPPRVSSPRERGVTSSSTMSLTSPPNTPAWTAAPSATTSSGLTVTLGSLPVRLLTRAWTAGILVLPPTRMISSISLRSNEASLREFSTGMRHLSSKSEHSSSNLALVRVFSMCLGPSAVAVMKGSEMEVWLSVESSILAFSLASVSLCRACLSFLRSMPSFFSKSSAKKSVIRLSKSSPPRWVSPEVDRTSKTPSPTSSTETSKVPPPKSNTRMVSFFLDSKPYAREAAVGSLMILSTSRPAIFPASLVACLWESLKYAGTVMTALSTLSFKNLDASSVSLRRT
mmetsp:Transcript_853/g.3333  ORF Transcript_853/g.3333 Transcript_853/m.3333 type:complete len:480 (-) Transcript_853:793-2232(-)